MMCLHMINKKKTNYFTQVLKYVFLFSDICLLIYLLCRAGEKFVIINRWPCSPGTIEAPPSDGAFLGKWQAKFFLFFSKVFLSRFNYVQGKDREHPALLSPR